jgi:hypothetical protein
MMDGIPDNTELGEQGCEALGPAQSHQVALFPTQNVAMQAPRRSRQPRSKAMLRPGFYRRIEYPQHGVV